MTGGSAMSARNSLLAAVLACTALLLPITAAAAEAVPRNGSAPGASVAGKPGKFDAPTRIDNKWIPMRPGTRWTYEGSSREDDGKVVPHRIIVTVTNLTKILGGVRTVVSYDEDFSDGELVEAELAFYAQDNDGNVWQFGEYPEEYEDGRFVRAPAWISGLQGARAGIMMPANPESMPSGFAQGWGPAVGWKDRGRLYKLGEKVSVSAGSFDGVLIIAESAAGEKDAEQLKYYAPGVGNIRTGWLGSDDKATEFLDLVKVEQLEGPTLGEARRKALLLEKSAYRRSKDVYAKTPAATLNAGGTGASR
jgi:hypothetical protein